MTPRDERSPCRGQALVETLLVGPLFLALAFGAVLVAQTMQSRLERHGLERRAAHSVAHFSPEERARAGWEEAAADIDAFLVRVRPTHPKLSCPSGALAGPRDVCLSSTHHGDAPTEPALRGLHALFPALGHKGVARVSRLQVKSPYLPGASTPFTERAAHHGRPLALSALQRAAPSHPARHGGVHGSQWVDDAGFNLSVWMAMRVPPRHATTAGGRLKNGLGALVTRTTGNARRAQAAACVLESVYESFGVGGLVELAVSSLGKGGAGGAGCPNASAVARAVEVGADAVLTAKAIEILALEACAETAAVAQAAGATQDADAARARCGGSPATGKATPGAVLEALSKDGVLGRYASGK